MRTVGGRGSELSGTVRAGLLAVLLLTAGTACSAAAGSAVDGAMDRGGDRGSGAAEARAQDGPLRVTQSDLGTTIVFGAPGTRRWSATAGSFELCSTSPNTVLSRARFVRKSGLLGSHAVIRRFVRAEGTGNRVEPVLAGFGVPPVVGDPEVSSRRRLPGSFEDVRDSRTPVPVCDTQEGSDVAELMVSATVAAAGGRAHDVALSYAVGATSYEWTMPLNMVLCGSKVTNRDC